MKFKTENLEGDALAWAVTECEYRRLQSEGEPVKAWVLEHHAQGATRGVDWLDAGDIITRKGFSLQKSAAGWRACVGDAEEQFCQGHATQPLTAVLRCYVAMTLGPEVEVPDSLEVL